MNKKIKIILALKQVICDRSVVLSFRLSKEQEPRLSVQAVGYLSIKLSQWYNASNTGQYNSVDSAVFTRELGGGMLGLGGGSPVGKDIKIS